MKILLIIGIGSFFGGMFRYLLSLFMISKWPGNFPIGTLIVNITGCLLIGILLGINSKINLSTELKLFLSTGLLGGFTTFSAFSVETITLMRNGQTGNAILYISCSIILGLAATFLGLLITRIF
ncbi:MAG TPA: fluoride efflux transporter CrcB [Saprospiraceae bacterium]|nr:fluoride efflux transporter CrcB [Saprospiraceae bacterium]